MSTTPTITTTGTNAAMGMDMDLDTDEIRSLDSDELREVRPNRWRGPPATWRTWTERDRRAWSALDAARRQDLAVHLYNAFGLRKGLREGPVVVDPAASGGGGGGEPGNEHDGDDDDDDKQRRDWAPGQLWTAWPLRAREVPDDALLPRTHDVNEPFTLRRAGDASPPFAGCNLEEELSATILRCAKERFLKRDLRARAGSAAAAAAGSVVAAVLSIEKGDSEPDDDDDDDDDDDHTAGATTTAAEDDEDGTDAAPRTPIHKRERKRKRKLASPTFTPVPSADDDLSYALIRPAARRIMARLDDTLMVLHNSRVAGLGSLSESPSASDEDETDTAGARAARTKTPLRRERERERTGTPPRRSRGGRPRKVHVPREGESEREMLIRLAREGKRRIPRFSDDDESGSDGGDEQEGGGRSKSRSRSRGRGRSRSRRSLSASSRASSRPGQPGSRSSSVSSQINGEKRLARWGLRNWRDVIGAAALAGFPPAVVARAAQRCATLFREEMTLHTLHERPATSDKPGVETVRYVPEDILRPFPDGHHHDDDDDDDDDDNDELFQLRTVSRQSSVKLGGASSSPEPERGPETPASRRSRSGTPAAVHLCPHPECPRAVEGFTRRTNLARHLQAMHGRQAAEALADEEDSADEMDGGGVHVDRFLKPIRPRKGWRMEDTRRRRTAGARNKNKNKNKNRAGREEDAGSEELDSDGWFLKSEALLSD